MSTSDERAEQGIALAESMLGEEFGQRMRAMMHSGGFLSDMARLGMAHSYTDCWSRDGLDRRARSLLTIGALIAMKQPEELKNHVRIGLSNGLTMKELEEALIHLSTYVGYPNMSPSNNAVREVLIEKGLLEEDKPA